MLRARERARAHLGRVLGDPGDHLLADVRVALDELRRVAAEDAEEVVEDQDLAIGVVPGADADHGNLHRLMIASVNAAGTASNTIAKQPAS